MAVKDRRLRDIDGSEYDPETGLQKVGQKAVKEECAGKLTILWAGYHPLDDDVADQ